jgi:ribosomal 30S subunit maturation factor RimM
MDRGQPFIDGHPPHTGGFGFELDQMDDLIGFSVYSADRQKLGTVEQVLHPQATAVASHGGHYLLIKPGMVQSLFGVEQVHIPSLHIASVDHGAGSIFLDVPSDMLEA